MPPVPAFREFLVSFQPVAAAKAALVPLELERLRTAVGRIAGRLAVAGSMPDSSIGYRNVESECGIRIFYTYWPNRLVIDLFIFDPRPMPKVDGYWVIGRTLIPAGREGRRSAFRMPARRPNIGGDATSYADPGDVMSDGGDWVTVDCALVWDRLECLSDLAFAAVLHAVNLVCSRHYGSEAAPVGVGTLRVGRVTIDFCADGNRFIVLDFLIGKTGTATVDATVGLALE